MYFYMRKGKQYLDLHGDLILTHNDKLVKTRTKSAAPVKVNNAEYACVKNGGFFGRVYLTFKSIGFVWGKNEALVPEHTDLNKPHVNEPPKDYIDCKHCNHDGKQSMFPGPCTGCGDSEYKNFEIKPGLKTESDGFK